MKCSYIVLDKFLMAECMLHEGIKTLVAWDTRESMSTWRLLFKRMIEDGAKEKRK